MSVAYERERYLILHRETLLKLLGRRFCDVSSEAQECVNQASADELLQWTLGRFDAAKPMTVAIHAVVWVTRSAPR